MKKTIFTFVMLVLITVSSFAQKAKDIEYNTFIVKTNFPKVYGVIVNEATANFYSDYKLQEKMIGAQCLSFSGFVVLVFTDPPEIPRDVLSEIQIQSIKRYCKNFTTDTLCDEFTDQFQKLDCSFSYMLIDWIGVMVEINEQIKSYNDINKPI